MPRLSRTAKGAFTDICKARSCAASTAQPSSTIRLTKPKAIARAAGRRPAVKISSIARTLGKERVNRYKPPTEAISPRDTSGRPNSADSDATIRSHARAISHPPASASPSTAAIHGFLRLACTNPAKPPRSVKRLENFPAATSFRSAPAENAVPPDPVSITTSISESHSVSFSISSRLFATSELMAFLAFGLLMVTSATLSLRVRRTTGLSLS